MTFDPDEEERIYDQAVALNGGHVITGPVGDDVSLVDELRAALLRGDEIGTLPPPEYLIDRILPARALSAIYGPSGHGKSFVVLDQARSILDGRTWHGHPTQQGKVFYVVAEGASGQAARFEAADKHYGIENGRSLVWLPRTVNLSRRHEVAALIAVLREEDPVLVVVDTQARCTVGVDENSNKEMGVVVDECERIVREAQTAVLLVHHSGADFGKGLRGATAEHGAMEAVLAVRRNGDDEIVFTVEKMKNGPEDVTHRFRLEPVGASVAVIEVAAPPSEIPEAVRDSLEVLAELDEGGGVASGKWRESVADGSERTFHRRRKNLLDAKLIWQSGTKNRYRYGLTDKGREALSRGQKGGLPPSANDCHDSSDGLSATATTPEGWQLTVTHDTSEESAW